MTPHYYILAGPDGHTPLPVDDVLAWARWFETANRRVAWASFGDVEVSTVFLGLDHNFFGAGPPLLFETMVFGAAGHTDLSGAHRYSTWDEAVAGHAAVCEFVAAAETPAEAGADVPDT